jgi:hypothetical protein
MWEMFDLFFGTAAAVLTSNLQILAGDIPTVTKIDAMISRNTHMMNRAVTGQGSQELTRDSPLRKPVDQP